MDREQSAHLKAIRRADEQTTSFAGSVNGGSPGLNLSGDREIDFEALVGSKQGSQGPRATSTLSLDQGFANVQLDDAWNQTDDWLSSIPATPATRSPNPTGSSSSFHSASMSAASPPGNKLKARQIPPTQFNAAAFGTQPLVPQTKTDKLASSGFAGPSIQISRPPIQPKVSSGPNYNIQLPLQAPSVSSPRLGMGLSGSNPMSTLSPTSAPAPIFPSSTPMIQPQTTTGPPGWSGSSEVLQPSRKNDSKKSPGNINSADWADFDPLG